jgi:hypothetical protein
VGAEFVVWAAVHGVAILLLDGLIRLDSQKAVDREVERVVRAVVAGLAQESASSPAWLTVRSAHTERVARRRASSSEGEPAPAHGIHRDGAR